MTQEIHFSSVSPDESVAIAQKARVYDAYPSPATHPIPLYPRTYGPVEPAHRTGLTSPGEASPSIVATPSLLATRGLEINSNGGNYYSYNDSRNRNGLASAPLLASPVMLSGPCSRQPSGRESPSLAGAFGIAKILPTLRIISWTPQAGEERTNVTIILDPLAINAAPSTSTSTPNFGPSSPSSSSSSRTPPVTRHFLIYFGKASAPTTYSRSKSEGAAQKEDSALVVLSTVVPPRIEMGTVGERVLVVVQVVDEKSRILEDVIVGEWDSHSARTSPFSSRLTSSLTRALQL